MHDEVDARTRRDIYFEKSDWKKFCLSEIYGAEKNTWNVSSRLDLAQDSACKSLENTAKCNKDAGGVTNCVPEFYCYRIKALKRIPADKKIIWQYWADGFDSPNIPELVKVCLRSVEKHTPQYLLFRLSDENLNEWIEMPCWLYKKKTIMSKAHFADLLRCMLLSLYGGLWLDASVFLTGEIPEYIFKENFFMYRRDDSEKDRIYWESTFANYFCWSPQFAVRSLIGVMYAKDKCKVVSDFASILLAFWEHNDRASDYFFFQILIEEYFRKHPESEPKIFNDTVPHLLRQYINENPAPGYSFSDILRKTTVHSLNYKSDVACRNLLDLFPEYRKYLN